MLRRTNGNIKVWTDSTKNTPILDENDEAVLALASLTEKVWIENPNGGSAFLELEARVAPSGPVLSSDRVQFFAFTSIVIGLHGEFQFPTDPPFGPNEGISVIAVALHQEAYDSHMYVENDGSGPVYDEIVDAVQNRGVTSVALLRLQSRWRVDFRSGRSARDQQGEYRDLRSSLYGLHRWHRERLRPRPRLGDSNTARHRLPCELLPAVRGRTTLGGLRPRSGCQRERDQYGMGLSPVPHHHHQSHQRPERYPRTAGLAGAAMTYSALEASRETEPTYT